MECNDLGKALRNLAEVLTNIDSIARVKVEITLVKDKPDKAKKESK